MNNAPEPETAEMLPQLEAQRDDMFERLEWLSARAGMLDRDAINRELEDEILRTERKWIALVLAIAHWEGVPVAYGQPH